MSYASYDDLVTRYPLAAKWAETESQVNSAFIHFAEVELNGLLASKFAVPLDAHPTMIDLTVDLAFARSMLVKDPKKYGPFHKAVLDRIIGIKRDDEFIYTGSGTTIYPTGGGTDIWSTTMGYHPTHSMHDAESAFSLVSSDRLYDEEADRE